MIQYAPLELCKKLQKMGCISESGFYWSNQFFNPGIPSRLTCLPDEGGIPNIPAFFQNDFTGATDQARDNCLIVWPEYGTIEVKLYDEYKGQFDIKGRPWLIHRHAMIDLKKEVWWQYLERTMTK